MIVLLCIYVHFIFVCLCLFYVLPVGVINDDDMGQVCLPVVLDAVSMPLSDAAADSRPRADAEDESVVNKAKTERTTTQHDVAEDFISLSLTRRNCSDRTATGGI